MATFEKNVLSEMVSQYGTWEKFAQVDGCFRIYESDRNYHTCRKQSDVQAILNSPHIKNPCEVWPNSNPDMISSLSSRSSTPTKPFSSESLRAKTKEDIVIFTTTATINKSIDVVWSIFTDTKTWATWYGGKLSKINPDWQKGAQLEWELGAPSTVIDFVSFKKICTKGGSGIIMNYLFSEVNERSTTVTFEKDFNQSTLSISNVSVVKSQLDEDLMRFKKYVESQIGYETNNKQEVSVNVKTALDEIPPQSNSAKKWWQLNKLNFFNNLFGNKKWKASTGEFVVFKQKYMKPFLKGTTNTYEEWTAPNVKVAKEFLKCHEVTAQQYYLSVETPEGNWCKDRQGVYQD